MFVDRLIGLGSPDAALRRAIQLTEQEKFAAAFPLLTRAAKAGIPDAEYRVARSYLERSFRIIALSTELRGRHAQWDRYPPAANMLAGAAVYEVRLCVTKRG